MPALKSFDTAGTANRQDLNIGGGAETSSHVNGPDNIYGYAKRVTKKLMTSESKPFTVCAVWCNVFHVEICSH